jgi:SAM-dependent methyltransferase
MKKYQETIHNRWTGRYDASIDLVGGMKGKRILDIGCSFGWFEKGIEDGTSSCVIGMDINRQQVVKAAGTVPKACFLQAGVPDLPFKKRQFDIVVMWETLEHLPRNKVIAALKSIRNILKQDGRFYLSTPKFDLRSTLTDPAWYLGHRHYTRGTLKDILKENGFNLIRIQSGGGFFEISNMVLFYPFKWLANREVPGKIFFEKKRSQEYERGRGWSTYFIEAGVR